MSLYKPVWNGTCHKTQCDFNQGDKCQMSETKPCDGWQEPNFDLVNLPEECYHDCRCRECGNNPKDCGVCSDCVDGSECSQFAHCFVKKEA